ncbi:DUF4760 domain-containing protein [Pseudoalteromonas rubra]|uniref:DUF4760 domain-containing protein n=1 Tax=Pseudoalteromonas rubra TaxID=43658 RepID=A0A0F4QMZ3_9GAMM|nr:DUF4760 domain-containing protein [Pseudoalteromonas rubra]KJZ09016.1 hypothetical protein TW77_10965 [Pseudoalteromonas rubra]
MEDVVTYSKVASSVITALSFMFGAYVYFSNTRRERIKNTLSYYESFSDSVFPDILKLSKSYPGVLSEETVSEIFVDAERLQEVVLILNRFERLSLGINLTAYDFKTISKVGGKTIISSFDKFHLFIQKRRESNESAWCESEALYKKLKKYRSVN